MSLYSMVRGKGPSGFGYGSTAEEVSEGLDLSGKRYLVTGCNSGLGFETMRVLALRGATVVGAARTQQKADDAAAEVDGDTSGVACELSEPESVRAAVAAVEGELDGIICNAGIMALPKRELAHGYEKQFFTNHMGHFILVTGLLSQLTDTGRVVMLSSDAHKMTVKGGLKLDDLAAETSYSGIAHYGQSKLSNLLFARELARRLPQGQTAYGVHPGVIATNLSRHLPGVAQAVFRSVGNLVANKTVPQGTATQVWAAVNPDALQHSGEYLADCNKARSSKHGRDMALATALWEKSEEIAAAM